MRIMDLSLPAAASKRSIDARISRVWAPMS